MTVGDIFCVQMLENKAEDPRYTQEEARMLRDKLETMTAEAHEEGEELMREMESTAKTVEVGHRICCTLIHTEKTMTMDSSKISGNHHGRERRL